MRYIFLLLLPVTVFATSPEEGTQQKTTKYKNLSTRKKLKIANKLYDEGSYLNAAEYYEEVVKVKKDNVKLLHFLAETFMGIRNYEKAEKYYADVIKLDAAKYPSDQFNYGRALKANGKYEEAKSAFKKYLGAKRDKDDIDFSRLAKIEMLGCDSAVVWKANLTKVIVENESALNKALPDYAARAGKGGKILYSSIKSDTAINVSTAKYDYYSKLYIAQKEGKEIKSDVALPNPPNSGSIHTGNGYLSADENSLYFTRCESKGNVSRMLCKIYKSNRNGAEWSDPMELKTLNKEGFSSTHPALATTADGKNWILFSSDQAGKGNMDIFGAELLADGSAAAPQKLSEEINTEGDDVTPFYDSKNGILYFSSNGRASAGGLDVFRVSGKPGEWGTAVNLGMPLNSSSDDLYFSLDETGKKGYLTSNREGSMALFGSSRADDIYNVVLIRDIYLKPTYVSRANNQTVNGVDAALYLVNGKNFDFIGSGLSSSEGPVMKVDRNATYKLNGTKQDFWPSVETITIEAEPSSDTIIKVVYIDPILKKKIKIENVYFEFDKSNVITFYQQQIDSVYNILANNPTYQLEVSGHTDSKGSDKYNEVLSKKRAEAVSAYLVKKGVEKARIKTSYLGESQPIAPNEGKDGSDDPEGRARNRRVEFKVIVDNPKDAPEFEYVPGEPQGTLGKK